MLNTRAPGASGAQALHCWLYSTAWRTAGVPDGFGVFARDVLLPRPAVLSLLLATQAP